MSKNEINNVRIKNVLRETQSQYIHNYRKRNTLFHSVFLFIRFSSRRVRDLWWQGLPPSVRGKVWSLAIGNDLNITDGTNVCFV